MADIVALGLDVGSTTTKIVGVDSLGEMTWHHLEKTEARLAPQLARLLALAQQHSATEHQIPLVSTGYGRNLVPDAGRRVTEITCHAHGVYRALGHGGSLVDIGGQDSKVILISSHGEVLDFSMSDKCAAGTGRFLENTAHRLGVNLETMGDLALQASQEVSISSTCTVFAETEVISLIANGVALECILKGLHRALVRRIVAMIRALGLIPPLILSGGVAWNKAVCAMLEEELEAKVILPEHPQLMGAYGAALLALKI